jgi:hypothetical protein
MTSTTTRIITIALTALALGAPVAAAAPMRSDEGVRTSSLAGTTSAPARDMRNPDNQVPFVPAQQPQTMKPVVRAQPEPVADDGGPSPIVFVAPSLALIAMLGAGLVYTRSVRPARA